MMSPEQVDDFKKFLEEKLAQRDAPLLEVQRALTELVEQQSVGDQTDERLGAIARAVTRLADGLTTAARNQRKAYDEINDALVSVLGVSGDALSLLQKDLSKLSVEDLAKLLPHSQVCAVREYQYRHGESNRTSDNTPAPLPPTPDQQAIVAVVAPASAVTTDEDDSIVVHTHDGKAHIRANIKAKTLLGWMTGLVMAGLYLYEKLKPLLGHH